MQFPIQGFTLLFYSIPLFLADSMTAAPPRNAHHSKERSLSANQSSIEKLNTPDYSHCKHPPLARIQWGFDGPSPRPFPMPQPSTDNQPHPGSIVSRSRIVRSFETQLDTLYCSELKSVLINQPATEIGGFLRLRVVDLELENWRYWLVWDTHQPVTITAYVKNVKTGLWEKETLAQETEPDTGAASWLGQKGKKLIVDIGVSPQGLSGEIALFQTNTPVQTFPVS